MLGSIWEINLTNFNTLEFIPDFISIPLVVARVSQDGCQERSSFCLCVAPGWVYSLSSLALHL